MNSKVSTYELKCKSCGGVLNIQEGSNILICPYCGAKEILEESDAVKIEKIRSETYKEVELERQKRMADRLDQDERSRYLKSRHFIVAVILIGTSLFGLLASAVGHSTASGVVAVIQLTLLILSILFGLGLGKGRFRNLVAMPVLFAGLLIFVYLILLGADVSDGGPRETKDFEWSDIAMNDALPDPEAETGLVYSNSSARASMDIDPYSFAQFRAYVETCREAGFTIDSQTGDRSYIAYNEEGYRIDLYYFESSGYMSLSADAPVEMSRMTWPSHGLAKMIPAPESETGRIGSDSNDYLNVYIGETSKEEYTAYVSAVMDAGFDIDYYRNDTSFSAKNSEGISVYIDYEGFNTMYIRMSDNKD